MVAEHIDDEGYQVFDKVTVRLERDSDLPTGVFEVSSHVADPARPPSREDVALAAARAAGADPAAPPAAAPPAAARPGRHRHRQAGPVGDRRPGRLQARASPTSSSSTAPAPGTSSPPGAT